MKRLFLVASLVLAAPAAAEAKCTKSALNGNWVFFPISASSGAAISISGGNFTIATTSYTITSFGKNCRGVGVLSSVGTSLPFIITSEGIKATSTAKPNMLTITYFSGPLAINQSLFRR